MKTINNIYQICTGSSPFNSMLAQAALVLSVDGEPEMDGEADISIIIQQGEPMSITADFQRQQMKDCVLDDILLNTIGFTSINQEDGSKRFCMIQEIQGNAKQIIIIKERNGSYRLQLPLDYHANLSEPMLYLSQLQDLVRIFHHFDPFFSLSDVTRAIHLQAAVCNIKATLEKKVLQGAENSYSEKHISDLLNGELSNTTEMEKRLVLETINSN